MHLSIPLLEGFPPNVLSRFLMEAVPCEMPSLMYGCGQYVSLIT